MDALGGRRLRHSLHREHRRALCRGLDELRPLEYTFTEGKGADIDRDYFSLFPNANVSYRLDKEGKHSLVAQYSRTISRPGFWSLTPNRMQVSDYTYQTGNPMLDPSYVNTCSLTAVLAYKYSLTLSASLQDNAIQQLAIRAC